MARKELIHTATFGRDAGARFKITEMSARAGHAWACRFILALVNAGADIPDNLRGSGMAGVAAMALQSIGNINSEVALGLMDELLLCVTTLQEGGERKLINDDFQEIKTIFDLQKAVFDMHISPFIQGGSSTSESAPKADQTAA